METTQIIQFIKRSGKSQEIFDILLQDEYRKIESYLGDREIYLENLARDFGAKLTNFNYQNVARTITPVILPEKREFKQGDELPAREIFEEWLKTRKDEDEFSRSSRYNCLLYKFFSTCYSNLIEVDSDLMIFTSKMGSFRILFSSCEFYNIVNKKINSESSIRTMREAKDLLLTK